eukprot:4863557-Pleurochrysis_carterae.AAC.1
MLARCLRAGAAGFVSGDPRAALAQRLPSDSSPPLAPCAAETRLAARPPDESELPDRATRFRLRLEDSASEAESLSESEHSPDCESTSE